MRVLVLGHTYVVGENRKKIAALVESGAEVTLVTPPSWRERDTGLVHEHRPSPGDPWTTHLVPASFLGRGSLWRPRGLPAVVDEAAPDILLVEEEPWSRALSASLSAAGPRPTVCFTWENLDRDPPLPLRRAERRNLSRLAGLIGGSEAAVARCRDRGLRAPAAVVPQLGVDTDLFRPAEDRHTARGADAVVGFVGRLVPEKGIEDLLAAAAAAEVPWRLRLVGAGPLAGRAQSAAEADSGGRIAVAGAVDHDRVPDVLRALDVLCLPSRTTPGWAEQFGHVLVEAQACAVPVVGTESGAIPDVVGRDEAAGVLVPEGDPQALAAALDGLAADPERRRRMGDAGRRRAEQRWTHAAVARGTLALLDRALELHQADAADRDGDPGEARP